MTPITPVMVTTPVKDMLPVTGEQPVLDNILVWVQAAAEHQHVIKGKPVSVSPVNMVDRPVMDHQPVQVPPAINKLVSDTTPVLDQPVLDMELLVMER